MRLSGLGPGSTIVEIGPGTGQATRPLAERGLRVLALEIDPRLADRARRNLAAFPDVSVRTTSFEAWDPGTATFDVVFACNSFHWVDPDIRFAKAAMVLNPQGHLVVISTPVVVPEGASQFWWAVQDDWAAVGAERVDPATAHPDLVEGLESAVRGAGLFEEPAVARHRFDVTLTADEHAANLSTQSGVKELPPRAQSELIERIRRRVGAQGGLLTVHHLAVLTAARLRAGTASDRAAPGRGGPAPDERSVPRCTGSKGTGRSQGLPKLCRPGFIIGRASRRSTVGTQPLVPNSQGCPSRSSQRARRSVGGMPTFEVMLRDRSVEIVDGADAYQQEGPMTTFVRRGDGRAVIDSWSTRVASFRTADLLAVRRREPAVEQLRAAS
jgi:SAM-dependent methyltransferase